MPRSPSTLQRTPKALVAGKGQVQVRQWVEDAATLMLWVGEQRGRNKAQAYRGTHSFPIPVPSHPTWFLFFHFALHLSLAENTPRRASPRFALISVSCVEHGAWPVQLPVPATKGPGIFGDCVFFLLFLPAGFEGLGNEPPAVPTVPPWCGPRLMRASMMRERGWL